MIGNTIDWANGKTILLVESDGCLRILLRECLEGAGYGVKDAASEKEAVRLAGLWGGNRPDILVCGSGGAEASGARLAGILRRERPGLAVVYLVGDELNVETLGGQAQHVQKPFSFHQLQSALESATRTAVRREATARAGAGARQWA